MSEARDILRERSKEIRAMQRLILRVDRQEAATEAVFGQRGDGVLVHNCIKAAFLMMLYNLAEAIVVTTIHELFERVHSERLAYDQVADKIRAFWVERRAAQVRHGSPETYAQLIREAIETVLAKEGLASFEREEIRKAYLGNVDGKLIRELATQLAIELNPRKSSHGGMRLLEVKTTRNQLGHGVYSFREVGATKSGSDLRETSIRVRRFLTDAVMAYERFMDSRAYAVPGNTAVAPNSRTA